MPEATLDVRVHPRASRARLELRDGLLHAYVTSPPVEGAANEDVIRLVSRCLGVAPSRLALRSGSRSRNKSLVVSGMTQSSLEKKLEEQLL